MNVSIPASEARPFELSPSMNRTKSSSRFALVLLLHELAADFERGRACPAP